jgi:nucleoside-diphosphate kinase
METQGDRPCVPGYRCDKENPQHRRPHNPLQAREKNPGCIRSLGTLAPIKDAAGNVLGERMDNLIHASANPADAEREVKLWFRPNDIPPAMHPYETSQSDEHYYYKDGKLFTNHEPGSACILAPGDFAWKTDLEALHLLIKGQKAACSVEAVVAKYLINEEWIKD